MSLNRIFNKDPESEDSWISISDLMAGLMIVFLFIVVIYAQTTFEANQALSDARRIVIEWRDIEAEIRAKLQEEFEDDLPVWKAEIDQDKLIIRFLAPEILFETGKADLNPRFQAILDDFIPRYIALLENNFSSYIDEVRIEGHTSSEWQDAETENEAFINNMELSQERTQTVLTYSLNLPQVAGFTSWMQKTVTANGLSSARPRENSDGTEDKEGSRRVEFNIQTKAQEEIFKVIERIAPTVRKAFP